MAEVAICLPAPSTVPGYADIAQAVGADFTVIGPEALLVDGIVDVFGQRNLKIVGPSRAAARLEGSKLFAKEFFGRAKIPTARSGGHINDFSYPVVVKADGLAGGKGVHIVNDDAEAAQAVRQLGPHLLIEEFLEGEEVSFIGLSNGTDLTPFAVTQDHKRLLDGDQGPNTGGMGAYLDGRILSEEQRETVLDRVMLPAMRGLAAEGTPFQGFLYGGLMMTAAGPKVLEFNVRMGDPETQVLMHAFRGDFADALRASLEPGRPLPSLPAQGCSVCVVLAAQGYPEKPRTGDVITGIKEAEATGATVFHAGTRLDDDQLVTAGGRVLGVTAGAATLPEAIANTYRAVEKIHFEGMQYRTDIGKKGLRRW